MVVGMVAGKRRSTSRDGQGVSPFDDSMAATGPAMPDPARDSAPGRARTFNGHDDFGRPAVRGDGGRGTEYEPLRANHSRESSLSDKSFNRR